MAGRVAAIGVLMAGVVLGAFGIAAHQSAADTQAEAEELTVAADAAGAEAEQVAADLEAVERRIEVIREVRQPAGAANQEVGVLIDQFTAPSNTVVEGFNRAVNLAGGGETAAAVATLEADVLPLLAEVEAALGRLPAELRRLERAADALLRELA